MPDDQAVSTMMQVFVVFCGAIGLQVTQQASEPLLVALMILPTAEVLNMARATNARCPGVGGLHHGIIEPNRKQDEFLLAMLLLQGCCYFLFDPRALYGMLREDQQELVIEANELINALTEHVASLYDFRGEPAAHTLALQVSIQVLGKVLIFTSITDKAGVVRDGAQHKRANIGDEGIGESCSAQERLGNVTLRPHDGVGPNRRRTPMVQYLQSLHRPQIDISEGGPPYCGFAEVGSTEVGSIEVGSDEVGKAEVGSAKVGSDEVGSDEVGSDEVGKAEVGSDEVGSDEVGKAEVGSVEVGSVEVGSVEVGSAEVGSAEVGSDEVGKAEVRSEVRGLLFPPCIPDRYPLPKTIKVLLACHSSFPLCCTHIITAHRQTCKHTSSRESTPKRRGRSNTRLLDTTPYAWSMCWHSRQRWRWQNGPSLPGGHAVVRMLLGPVSLQRCGSQFHEIVLGLGGVKVHRDLLSHALLRTVTNRGAAKVVVLPGLWVCPHCCDRPPTTERGGFDLDVGDGRVHSSVESQARSTPGGANETDNQAEKEDEADH